MKMDNKTILDNKSKFVLVHSSSGFKHALKGWLQTIFNQTYINEKQTFWIDSNFCKNNLITRIKFFI